jgi:ATP adenylyltransferase
MKWPFGRSILFRPDRMKYVKKLMPVSGCVFCRTANESEKFETLCLFKSKLSQIVLNKYPYNNGHLLVLPLRHVGKMWDLTAEEKSDLFNLVDQCFTALRDVYEPNGINMGMNHGQSSGAGIPDHLHIHVIPRWSGDVNFFPIIAETKVVIESLEDSYARLKEYFDRIKK